MSDDENFGDYRDRVHSIMNKLHSKDVREIKKMQGQIKPKKHKDPEKDVEKECLAWMRARGWDVNIYEAKAVYNPDGTYRSSRMKAGVCDCMGITPDGIPIYIEFKAPGSRSTFNTDKRVRQREFLLKKIDYCGFGAVIDSLIRLENTWNGWVEACAKDGKLKAREFLLTCLPQKRISINPDVDTPLFDE